MARLQLPVHTWHVYDKFTPHVWLLPVGALEAWSHSSQRSRCFSSMKLQRSSLAWLPITLRVPLPRLTHSGRWAAVIVLQSSPCQPSAKGVALAKRLVEKSVCYPVELPFFGIFWAKHPQWTDRSASARIVKVARELARGLRAFCGSWGPWVGTEIWCKWMWTNPADLGSTLGEEYETLSVRLRSTSVFLYQKENCLH